MAKKFQTLNTFEIYTKCITHLPFIFSIISPLCHPHRPSPIKAVPPQLLQGKVPHTFPLCTPPIFLITTKVILPVPLPHPPQHKGLCCLGCLTVGAEVPLKLVLLFAPLVLSFPGIKVALVFLTRRRGRRDSAELGLVVDVSVN
jgi:hypothetical protein